MTRRSRERFDLAALQRIAAAEPERLSPNVLLRPVIESALLPTVAYLAGPGELRYLALTPPVYERMRIPRQLALPRWSGILVEPRVDRVLQKFNIELDDLLAAVPVPWRRGWYAHSCLTRRSARCRAAAGSAIETGYDSAWPQCHRDRSYPGTSGSGRQEPGADRGCTTSSESCCSI